MLYDSLLLNYGGGIISDTSRSKQYNGSAALAIGIGGTGVAALSTLKGKIYSQLHPDNPDDPVPRYSGIQLLAIDSDETDYKKYRGNCMLRDDEFFSISNSKLAGALQEKGQIMGNPLMNWMEIEKIQELLSPQGAGGVRQVGRYLLMSKASSLDNLIQSKCSTALKARGKDSLDIYIFAGISGGTGSGCFLDVCYIVRQIIKRNGWNAQIMGYFFLPDVVTSKPEVMAKPSCVSYNNSNGYAAMKEMDYLMSLKSANDRFVQNYGANLMVDTQDPPVDMCHLISAVRADGSLVPNGFSYGINVASDYAMAYLADVDLKGQGDESGLTMRGHLANVTRGVDGLPRRHGANLSYHVLGASNAEIPMSKINTYLACGFYEKFMKAISGDKIVVAKSTITDFAKKMGFISETVFKAVVHGTPGLQLIDVDPKILAASPKPAKGYLCEEWAKTGNDWLSACEGRLLANAQGLTQKLDSYDYGKANVESLIGKLFRRLWELSIDPAFGPYYAAQILHNGSYDLISELEGAIKTTDDKVATYEMYRDDADRNLEACKDVFHDKSNKKNYANFQQAATNWYSYVNMVKQLRKTAEVLRTFKKLANDLYTGFFKPLTEMLDNLKETFKANQIHLDLNNDDAASSSYTWQILSLEDIKYRLDESIEKLTPKQMVNDFIGDILAHSDAWLGADQDKISMFIRKQMLELFKEESARSLQTYLFDKYPGTEGDVTRLAEAVKDDIMTRIHNAAVPMFWCDPSFDIFSEDNSFHNSSLSVPSSASAVCTAASNFRESHKDYSVRETGIGDRIFAMRLFSGIPLYAYQGITLLKSYYDRAENTSAGVGNHLYAYTGRGEAGDESGRKDWLHYLPTPLPYSKVRADRPSLIPEGEELLKLYEEGEACGAIAVNSTNDYAIFRSPKFQARTYTLADFTDDEGRFNMPAYQQELDRLTDLAQNMHQESRCSLISLKNDGTRALGGDVVPRTRRDYFIHYPKLQEAVREEIRKVADVQFSIESLNAVLGDHNSYEKDLERYCGMLFYRHLHCENSMEQEDHNKTAFVYSTYVDKYGDQRRADFSIPREEKMPFGKTYPLYQAFLTYRSLDPKKSPRAELDKAVSESENRRKTLEDLCVPYDLEQIWTLAAVEALAEETAHMPSDVSQDILRFYEGLRRNVRNLKDDSPVWLTAAKREELRGGTTPVSETPAPAPAPDAYWHVWDPTTGKTLVVYAQYGPANAFDSAANAWVPVRADMKVWNGQSWADLKSVPFFAGI